MANEPTPDVEVRADLACPDPETRPDLWPWGARRREDGVLVVGDVPLTDLARRTPVFVWDTADFLGRAQVWKAAMDEAFWPGYGLAGAHVHYAAKAFMCARAARLVTGAGLGIDTASLGELETALRAGADPALVGLHGNNKSVVEIDRAIEAGIGRIIADSLPEIDMIAERATLLGATDVPVMVRVTTGVHAGGHEYISTAHEDQKFGLSLEGAAFEAARRIAEYPRLRLAGLHSHIGSQIFAIDGFVAAVERVLSLVSQLRETGLEAPELDIGGGYGIAYTGADPVPPAPKDVANALADAVSSATAKLSVPVPHVSIEPGRSIAGPSQVMLYTVGTVKTQPLGQGRERTYVSIDGGMSDNVRPALYGAAYTATLANRVSEAEMRRCRVVGKHCESGDIVIHDVVLPGDIAAGDLLAVPAVGAYGYSMASNYNMLPRPGVVAVEGGRVSDAIRRESVDDLLARDCGLR